jgi:ribonucleotide reductase beta subunit family protein with ferritin-like domain
MLKHLQNISDYKVEYVTENDFYMNKDAIEDFVEYLLTEKLRMSGNE